jgi:transposase-like protein
MTADHLEIKKRAGVRAYNANTHAHEILSMTELPPPNTRWVARRKAAVVAAVSSGMITLEEACGRYQMSEEEFCAWRRAFENFGILGLRADCVQQKRGLCPSRTGRRVARPTRSRSPLA